jgi:hypothetical protein
MLMKREFVDTAIGLSDCRTEMVMPRPLDGGTACTVELRQPQPRAGRTDRLTPPSASPMTAACASRLPDASG